MAEAIMFLAKTRGLKLVVVPSGMYDASGKNKLKSKSINFVWGIHGAAYKTSDPKEIEFLKEHSYFKQGKIQIFDPEEHKEVTRNQGVQVGMVSSAGKEDMVQTEEPEMPKVKKIKAAKIKK